MIDWSTSVNVIATGTGPAKGAGFTKTGYYYDDGEFIDGFGLIRFGPNMGRGAGIYMVTLPVPCSNPEAENFTIINGTVTIGWSLTHRVGNLHVCGIEGFENNGRAVMIIDNSLFVADDNPASGDPLSNIHWSFRYPKEQ